MKFFFLYSFLNFLGFSIYLQSCPTNEEKELQEVIKDIDSLLSENPTESNIIPDISVKMGSSNGKYINESNTHLLIFGGGYSPSGNQVSLESNVKYFYKIRERIGLKNAKAFTFFADGKDNARDLQFFDPSYSVPKINAVLAELFGKPQSIRYQYRSNQLNPNDASSLSSIDNWFKQRKKALYPETNLIYFTGHGGKGATKTPHDTTAYLWANAKLKVSDFVKKLDQLPQRQSTILIMVQCYSGGFANILFKDGDPKKELSQHPRAGFFSTIQTRVAAGCTPDIRSENYKEYSTSFWEALSGVSRTGQIITQPDYDNDGETSLMEAHSYVIIKSNTIDIPIKTSDILLRKYFPDAFSAKKDNSKETNVFKKYLPKIFKKNEGNSSSENNFRLEELSRVTLLNWAGDEEKAVFLGLSKILKLNDEIPGIEIKSLQENLKKERQAIEKKKKSEVDQKNKFRDELRKKIQKLYPEISNPHHPVTTSLISSPKKEQILELVNQNQIWQKLTQQVKKIGEFENQRFMIEKKEVKIMRIRRCMENIVLTHALLENGSSKQKAYFKRLVDLECNVPQNQ